MKRSFRSGRTRDRQKVTLCLHRYISSSRPASNLIFVASFFSCNFTLDRPIKWKTKNFAKKNFFLTFFSKNFFGLIGVSWANFNFCCFMGLSYVKLHEKNDATKISSLAALELELWPLNPMYDPGALFANFFSTRPKWTFHSLKDAEKCVY